MSNKVPILINAFNRPETTHRVFEVVKRYRPEKLFLALDGPRKHKSEDVNNIKEIIDIFSGVNWECDVFKLFREENLGCPLAIPDAIDWFFRYIKSGVILEDDCLPDISFFNFCEELLVRYESEDSVMMISGNNFMPEKSFSNDSYFFSKYGFIWGWATWKRAWSKFDASMSTYPHYINSRKFKKRYPGFLDSYYWKTGFNNKYRNYSNAWAMKWNYAMAYNDGLSVIPSKNLVKNIGFGPDATMTKSINSKMILEVSSMEFPLVNPEKIQQNVNYDKQVFRRNFLSQVNLKSLLTNYRNSHFAK